MRSILKYLISYQYVIVILFGCMTSPLLFAETLIYQLNDLISNGGAALTPGPGGSAMEMIVSNGNSPNTVTVSNINTTVGSSYEFIYYNISLASHPVVLSSNASYFGGFPINPPVGGTFTWINYTFSNLNVNTTFQGTTGPFSTQNFWGTPSSYLAEVFIGDEYGTDNVYAINSPPIVVGSPEVPIYLLLGTFLAGACLLRYRRSLNQKPIS